MLLSNSVTKAGLTPDAGLNAARKNFRFGTSFSPLRSNIQRAALLQSLLKLLEELGFGGGTVVAFQLRPFVGLRRLDELDHQGLVECGGAVIVLRPAGTIALVFHQRLAQMDLQHLFPVDGVFGKALGIGVRGRRLFVVHGRSPLAMRISQFFSTSAAFNAAIAAFRCSRSTCISSVIGLPSLSSAYRTRHSGTPPIPDRLPPTRRSA